MDDELSNASPERLVYLRDPTSSLLRSYVLSFEAYESLVAEGVDLETVAEEELARRAICHYEYDALDRVTTMSDQTVHGPATTYCYDNDLKGI